MIRSFLDGIGFFARNLVVTYNWLQPELSLGGCVMKYARATYPELIQSTLSYDNISKFVRSVYGMMYNYIQEFLDENRQGMAIERERIGAKIAQLTNSDAHITSDHHHRHTPSANTYMKLSPNYNADYFNYAQEYGMLQSQHHQENRRQSRENEEDIITMNGKSFNEYEPRRQMVSFKFNENNSLTNSINKGNMNFPKKIHKFMSDIKWRKENVTLPQANVSVAIPTTAQETVTTVASPSPSSPNRTTTNNVKNKFLEIKLKDNSNVVQSNKTETKRYAILYVGPRQFPASGVAVRPYNGIAGPTLPPPLPVQVNVPNENSLTTFESSDLNYKTSHGNDDNLFDFESVILEFFGVKTKGKSITLNTCTQKYVIHILLRMLEGYFTG